MVNYNAYNSSEPDISQWLIANPGRINLGRIGLLFVNKTDTVESDLGSKTQMLDLYTGTIQSSFVFNGALVELTTACDSRSDSLAISIKSELLASGQLGLFFDFPYPSSAMFQEPVVGIWGNSTLTTSMTTTGKAAVITQTVDENSHYVKASWSQSKGSMTGPIGAANGGANQYHFTAAGSSSLDLTVEFRPDSDKFHDMTASKVQQNSARGWELYWAEGAFLDLTGTQNANASELQRRVILSQYLLAVNSAAENEPQGM